MKSNKEERPKVVHRASNKIKMFIREKLKTLEPRIQDGIDVFMSKNAWVNFEKPTFEMLLQLRKELAGIIKSGMLERQNREEDIIILATAILIMRMELLHLYGEDE